MPAPWAYFDTSVLLKRYIREAGSAQARASLRRYRFLRTTQVKTLDAPHLASVVAFQAMSGIRIPFITADVRQWDAASQLDLTVIGIGSARKGD